MKKTNKKYIATKRKMQLEGYWFTQKEANRIVREAKKIGFEPIPKFTKDKKFDVKKVEGSIDFLHKKTEEYFKVERYEIKNAGLSVDDKVTDIFFTLLFKKWSEEIEMQAEML